MSGIASADDAREARRRYVQAFNATMVQIWLEQLRKLDVFRTGSLYHSVVGVGLSFDEKVTTVKLEQSFNLYGIYVDQGTGSNTPRGNSGDLGEGFVNRRRRKQWFSRKYYASVMNIQEFFADSLGQQCCLAISNALNTDAARRLGG